MNQFLTCGIAKQFQYLQPFILFNACVALEVGCPGTWGLELLFPTQVARAPHKPALPATQPRAPARHTQPQPKHPSHRARSSVEITITIIMNKSNNNTDNNKNRSAMRTCVAYELPWSQRFFLPLRGSGSLILCREKSRKSSGTGVLKQSMFYISLES